MANGYNKVILVGNLTRDPQTSYLPSQTPVVEFGLAVNRKWKDQSGQQREDVCFIDCRAMGRIAEIIQQYLTKGKQVLIDGRLQFDSWEGKDGTKRSKHRVFVENMQMLGAPGPGGGGGGGGAPGGAPRPAQRPAAGPPPPQQQYRPQPQQAAPPPMEQPAPPETFDEPTPPPQDSDLGGGSEEFPF
jgi:single-strand DNA-binding protein